MVVEQAKRWRSESGGEERVERQRRRSGTRQHRRQGISPCAAAQRYPKSRTRPLATARKARTPCARTLMACGTVRGAGAPLRLHLPSSSLPMAAAYSATPPYMLLRANAPPRLCLPSSSPPCSILIGFSSVATWCKKSTAISLLRAGIAVNRREATDIGETVKRLVAYDFLFFVGPTVPVGSRS